jgi:hypothetical protein
MPTYRITYQYIAKAHIDLKANSLAQAKLEAHSRHRSEWTWPVLDVEDVNVISYDIAVIAADPPPPPGPLRGSGYD